MFVNRFVVVFKIQPQEFISRQKTCRECIVSTYVQRCRDYIIDSRKTTNVRVASVQHRYNNTYTHDLQILHARNA